VSVEDLFQGYLARLRKQAPMWVEKQLLGRMEDDLAREFVLHARGEGLGALFNAGSRNRRYDVVLGPKDGAALTHVSHLFEFKYLRNRHGETVYDASDEVTSSLDDLCEQLARPPRKLGELNVRLRSRNNAVYAVVLCSTVEPQDRQVLGRRDRAKSHADFSTIRDRTAPRAIGLRRPTSASAALRL
jgi:hypothetical protein